jgi:hypothetical protein
MRVRKWPLINPLLYIHQRIWWSFSRTLGLHLEKETMTLGLFDECELIKQDFFFFALIYGSSEGIKQHFFFFFFFQRKMKLLAITDCWIRKVVQKVSKGILHTGREIRKATTHKKKKKTDDKGAKKEKVQQDKWEAIKQARKSLQGWAVNYSTVAFLIYIYEVFLKKEKRKTKKKKNREWPCCWGMRDPKISTFAAGCCISNKGKL